MVARYLLSVLSRAGEGRGGEGCSQGEVVDCPPWVVPSGPDECCPVKSVMLERGKRRKMSDSRYRAGLTAYKKKKVMANQRLG